MSYKTFTLNNGVPVLFVQYPSVESATIGISYNVGGRNEWRKPLEFDGISHFLEHQFFKGNKELTPEKVSERLDELGGHNNAFTTEDCTVYYAKVPKEDIFEAIDLWFSLLDYGEISQEEFDKESFVVRQELRRMEDDPEYFLFVKMQELLFKGTSLEMTVIGNEHSLENVKLKDMEAYREEFYDLSNAILMVVGAFNEDAVLRKLNSTFGSKVVRRKKPEYVRTSFEPPTESRMTVLQLDRETPLVYFGLALKTPGAKSKYAAALQLLSIDLSSGRSSRLQKNVVRQGICSFSYVENELWEDVGSMILLAGTRKELYLQAHEAIFRTLHQLLTENISEERLQELKERIEFSLRKSMENPSNIVFQQGVQYWRKGRFESMDEQLQRYREVSTEDYQKVKELILENLDVVYGIIGHNGGDVPNFPEGTW